MKARTVQFRKLFPHQIEALSYCRSRDHYALFMEMRLGKTLVVIRNVKQLPSSPNAKILVLAPMSSLLGWMDDLDREGERYVQAFGIPKADKRKSIQKVKDASTRQWLLLNHESLALLPELRDVKWTHVVVDESVALANVGSKFSKACTSWFREVPHRCILTGLPSPENDLQLFGQFLFLHGSFCGFTNYWNFRKAMCTPVGYEWIPKSGSRKMMRLYLHEHAFVKRRSEVRSFTEKIYKKWWVDLPSNYRTQYENLLATWMYEYSPSRTIETSYAPVLFSWARRMAGGFDPLAESLISRFKIEALKKLITSEFSREPVHVWCAFKSEVDLIEREFAGLRKTAKIHGDITGKARMNVLRDFQEGDVDMLIATPNSIDRGVDLSVCSTFIYFSAPLSYDLRGQSSDRGIIMTKTEPILVIDMISKGTVDEDVMDLLHTKHCGSESMLRKIYRKMEASHVSNKH